MTTHPSQTTQNKWLFITQSCESKEMKLLSPINQSETKTGLWREPSNDNRRLSIVPLPDASCLSFKPNTKH